MNNLITPIIFLLASIGLFFGFINPQYDQSKATNQTISSLEQTQQEADHLDTLEQSIRDKYDSIGSDQADRLQKMLPDSIDTIRLITEMDGVASQYGLTLTGLSIGSGTQNVGGSSTGTIAASSQTPYGTLPFSFSVTTTYGNFLSFLQSLEHSLQIIDVNSVSISGITTSKNNTYTYSVSAQTYWLQ